MTIEQKIQIALRESDCALIDEILADPVNVAYLASEHRSTFLLFNLARPNHPNYNDHMANIEDVINNITIMDLSVKFTGGDYERKNSFWFAAKHNEWGIVDKFISLGANINEGSIVDRSIVTGESVFWLLAKAGQWDEVKRQVQLGRAYINITHKTGNGVGKSVLQLAIEANQRNIIINLLEQSEPVSINESQIGYLLPIMVDLWLREQQEHSLYNLGVLPYNYFKSPIIARFHLVSISIDNELLHETILNIINHSIASKVNSLLVYKYPEAPRSEIDHTILNTIYNGSIVSKMDSNFITEETRGTESRKIINDIDPDMVSRLDDTKKTFYTQFALLINEYKSIIPSNLQNSFDDFYKKVQKPNLYFSTDSAKFYENLKEKLEEIYIAIINLPVTDTIRVQALAELSQQLNVCGPGIFNSINIVHAYTRPRNVATWIAHYRALLVSDVAMKIKKQRSTSRGMSIHVDAEVTMIAQQNKYAPLGGREQLEQGDRFVHLENHENVDAVKKLLKDTFEKKYTLIELTQYLKELFISDVREKLNINLAMAIESESYTPANKTQICQIAGFYGISIDANFLDENAEFSEDYTNVTIDLRKIDDLIIDELHSAGIFAWNHEEITMRDGTKLIYSSERQYKKILVPTEMLEKIILDLKYTPSSLNEDNYSMSNVTAFIKNIVFNMLKNNLIPQDKIILVSSAIFTLSENNVDSQKKSLVYICQTMIDINKAILKAEQERLEQERLEQDKLMRLVLLVQERLVLLEQEKQARLEDQARQDQMLLDQVRLEQQAWKDQKKQVQLNAINKRLNPEPLEPEPQEPEPQEPEPQEQNRRTEQKWTPEVEAASQKKHVNVTPKTVLSKIWDFIKNLISEAINHIVDWLYGTTPNVEIFTDPRAVENLQNIMRAYETKFDIVNEEVKVHVHAMSICGNTEFKRLATNFLTKYRATQDTDACNIVSWIKDAQAQSNTRNNKLTG